uniref:Uncharacterized protein LOC114334451 n=1 Tax=Diabrotica virgifera virgifera TaxID=50390 RepID=A0A6P7G6Z7_DIAVI
MVYKLSQIFRFFKMSLEKQLAYLEKLHAEFLSDSEPEAESDDDDASLEGDYEEVQDHDTDMEEGIEERILESRKAAAKIDLFPFIHVSTLRSSNICFLFSHCLVSQK